MTSPAVERWPWLPAAAFGCAVLAVFWAPFTGGPRFWSFLLFLLGIAWVRVDGRAFFEAPARRRLLVLLALLWVPILASWPGSFDPADTAGVAGALPAYGLAGLALVALFGDLKQRWRYVTWVNVVMLAWLADGMVQYLFGRDLLGIPLTDAGRVVGVFGDNLLLSIYVATWAPVLLFQAARKNPLWALPVFLLAVAVVLLSGQRAAWVMILLAGVLVFATFPWRFRLGALALTLVLAAGFFAGSDIVRTKVSQSLDGNGWSFSELDRMLSWRLTLWDTSMKMISDHPVTGVGALAFDRAYPHYAERADDPFTRQSYGVHAHQFYISAAAETGLLGLAGLIVMWWLVIRWYLAAGPAARLRARPFAYALFLAAFPVNAQPTLFRHTWFPLLLILMTLLLASLDEPGGEDDVGAAEEGAA